MKGTENMVLKGITVQKQKSINILCPVVVSAPEGGRYVYCCAAGVIEGWSSCQGRPDYQIWAPQQGGLEDQGEHDHSTSRGGGGRREEKDRKRKSKSMQRHHSTNPARIWALGSIWGKLLEIRFKPVKSAFSTAGTQLPAIPAREKPGEMCHQPLSQACQL